MNIKNKIDVNEVIALNEQGLNQKQIAERLGIKVNSFAYWVNKLNIPIQKRNKYYVNEDFFDVIDTEEKAYLLGYFIADGCLCYEDKKHNGVVDGHSKRLSLTVSEDDREVIELFQKFICPSKPIEHSNNQSGVKVKRKPQLKFRWNSDKMFDKLVSYGIKPRKTYDNEFKLPNNLIPDKLLRHFIRGYFDGDGTKGRCSLQFCVNSKHFAKQIADFFAPLKSSIREIQGKTCIYYVLQINGGKCLMAFTISVFYKDASYYLSRKKDKFDPELIDLITKGKSIV